MGIATQSPYSIAADELQLAGRDSQTSERLEKAVVLAFSCLGFHAEHKGGPGQTDVVVEIPIGAKGPSRVIIDAKSAASGLILERQVNFDTILEHKKLHQADIAVIVGPEFEGERLIARAMKHNVALISTQTLAEVVRKQELCPLPPAEIMGLFEPEDKRDSLLSAAWSRIDYEQSLLTHVLAVLVREAADGDPVFGGALSAENVYMAMRSEMEKQPSIEEIKNALEFLASPMIRALRKNGSSFTSMEDPLVTSARMRLIAGSILKAHQGAS